MPEPAPGDSRHPCDPQFAERVLRYLDERLSPDEIEEFNEELLNESAKREFVIDFCLVDALLREEISSHGASPSPGGAARGPIDQNRPVRRQVRHPPARQEARHSRQMFPHVLKTPRRATRRRFSRRRSPLLALAASLLLIAVITVLAVLSTRHPPGAHPMAVLASIAGEQEAVWNEPVPAGLHAGQMLHLNSGLAQLAFARGGHLVLEGPAELRIDTRASVTLLAGKLAATIHGGGFSVATPSARVTDLGTQFGVAVQSDGTTRLDVFQGRVQAKTAGSGKAMLLTSRQAASISTQDILLDAHAGAPQTYVFDLPEPTGSLDLVDLICGGDGCTHRRGTLIDVRNGRAGVTSQIGSFAGDDRYHPVPGSKVVDGVFVPAPKGLATQIDSGGDQFTFLDSSGLSYLHIVAGGPIPRATFNLTGRDSPMRGMLDGVDYSADGHGMLAMHANKGLTIDLARVRQLHPGDPVVGFSALVGNSFVPDTPRPRLTHRVDVYVIVDGAVRFRRLGITEEDHPVAVRVPLLPKDRFLTLVTTDAGDGISGDHLIWADPQLRYRHAPR